MHTITTAKCGESTKIERPLDITVSARMPRGAYIGPRTRGYAPNIRIRKRKGWHSQCIAGTRGEASNWGGVR